jgi:DMSO/TMAO reductase YedYZ molybdopterin-dependent catalytic subunit
MIMVIRWNRLPSCTLLLILTWILYLGSFDNAWAQQKTGDAVAAGAQSDDSLDLRGDVPNPRLVSAAELHKLPRAEMRTTDPDNSGNEIVYSGTPLIEVLKADGLLFDSGMARIRQAVTITLLVEAADGYRAVFALAELDPELTDRVVLLADAKDGQPLPANEGPFRIIVPGEKRSARWVRQVKAITVRQN